jgi:uncharacterized integral membrane protein (TIGR00698 family)
MVGPAKTASSLETLRHYESLEGMEGLELAPASGPAPSAWSRSGALAQDLYPGILVALTIGLAATWLSQHYGAPVMLFALLFGIAFHFLHEEGRCVRGIDFAARTILRIGVALLGVRITFDQIVGLGAGPVLMVTAAVAATIAVGLAAARLLGLRPTLGVLTGGAVAICGASAALAIASVLPKRPDGDRDTILTVVCVTALSTVAMIFYPVLSNAIGLDHTQAGLFLGGTIHDVAQVVGAGYTISPETGDIATYVKLLRVALLLPIVLVISLVLAQRASLGGRRVVALVPFFLLAFAALVALNSLGAIPKYGADLLSDISRWCLVTAVAALGMKTSFRMLVVVGWRPVALMVAETLFIAAFVLGGILIVG